MKFKYLACVLLVGLSLAGCSTFASEDSPEPVSIGGDRNELKRSPCACNEVPQDYSGWMVTLS